MLGAVVAVVAALCEVLVGAVVVEVVVGALVDVVVGIVVLLDVVLVDVVLVDVMLVDVVVELVEVVVRSGRVVVVTGGRVVVVTDDAGRSGRVTLGPDPPPLPHAVASSVTASARPNASPCTP